METRERAEKGRGRKGTMTGMRKGTMRECRDIKI
jgi:hypothetical protein